jgi:hypothetical protein
MTLIETTEGKGAIYLGKKFVGSCNYMVKTYEKTTSRVEAAPAPPPRASRLLLTRVRAVLDGLDGTLYMLRTDDRREIPFIMESSGEAEAMGTLGPTESSLP